MRSAECIHIDRAPLANISDRVDDINTPTIFVTGSVFEVAKVLIVVADVGITLSLNLHLSNRIEESQMTENEVKDCYPSQSEVAEP